MITLPDCLARTASWSGSDCLPQAAREGRTTTTTT